MTIQLLLKGDQADLMECQDERGRFPVQTFLETLTMFQQKQVLDLFRTFAKQGAIHNIEKFRNEGKPIFCFKVGQVRIPCFYLPNAAKRTLVVTHGFLKKQVKMPRSEWERAFKAYQAVTGTREK